jgi:DNA polymerase-1
MKMKIPKAKRITSDLLVIIDGNNMAHRARHTFNLSYKGEDVSVTYGFLRMLGSILEKFRPTSILVAWDYGVPEFRRKTLPEYKANRHLDDDPDAYADFIRQIQELADYVLPMAGITNITKHGSEADDIMYHASRISKIPVLIVSSDKDMFQCINENVSVYNPGREKVYTSETIKEEYGIDVKDIVHWRAIQGDSSDNIAGVVGVGEKTATKLFQTFGSLTAIENAVNGANPKGEISGKLKEAFLTFGSDRIVKNVYVMALYMDRTGVRKTIWETVGRYKAVDRVRLSKYFLQKSFSSLTELPGELTKLSSPILKEDVRIPVVCGRRFPI